jgi:transposase
MATKKQEKTRNQSGALPILKLHAAGIDIGAREIYVAVPADRDPQPVRCFPTFTEDLHRLADWLQSCGITTVAMESTSVYWIPLYQILEARGLEVCLVNARYYQNVPGRRTDVCDCQWLQYLHAVGLLRASFRPKAQVCVLRSLLRHREHLVQAASSHVLHMHKALDQMNLQIHHVLSDITGVSGLAIVDAILAGERDPQRLAQLRHARVQASETIVGKALVGDYREEHLFTLRQSLAAYRYYQQLIAECDRAIETQLRAFDRKLDASAQPPRPVKSLSRPRRGYEPSFDLRGHLYRILGVDLTTVPGLSVLTVHTLLSEVGPDLSSFRSASAFCSWLGLCPDNEKSGGKVLAARTRKVKSRAALAFRLAANSLHRSQSYLGNYFRRMRAKLGAPKAITAAAHKLARIDQYQKRSRIRTTARLKAQAASLGFQLLPITPLPTRRT